MTDIEIYEENLQHFQIVRRHGDSAQCRCPSHPDKQASLTVSKGRKCTLIHCHAGCQLNDILMAAGLEKQDLFYKPESQGTDWKHYVESREHRKIEATYDYVSCNDGSYLFTKIRLQGKKMLFGILENNRFSYGLKGQSRKQLKAIYGSLEAIKKAIRENKPVFIVEGEKDTITLQKQGYTAFTYGGVNDWQSDFAELLRDANVIILADNDEPGKTVAQRIYDDLKGIAKSRKVIVPMPDVPKADTTDYFEAGHSKEEFEALINGTTLQKNRAATAADSPKYILEQLNALRAAERFQMNDRGSVDLFATIFKNISRYNPTKKDWMYYDKTYEKYGFTREEIEELLKDGIMNQGFSVNVAYNGIRMALAHATGEHEYFSIEDMMEITGESREEVVKQVEDMRAAALAAGKNPDDYAVPVERKILYFPDGFTS